MNDDTTPSARNTTVEALQKAQDAAMRSMEILQEAGDHEGSLKAARAVADITARLGRLELPGEQTVMTGAKAKADLLEIIAEVLEDDDAESRRENAVFFRQLAEEARRNVDRDYPA